MAADVGEAAVRSALVIGNGAYQASAELPNPPNDANAIAAKLEAAGFEVSSGVDLDKAGMERVISNFLRGLDGSEIGVVFYAGHGLQVEGRNYLVPVDAKLQDEVDVSFQAIALDDIQAQMERAVDVSVIFLDACRDNPLARNLARSMGKTRSTAVGQGLAETRGAVGSLVAYATQPDNVALDGDGEHSPFTEALLEHISTPGLEIRQVLTRVRKDVIESTDGRQVPWDHSSLTDDVYFQFDLRNQSELDPSNAETVFWRSISTSSNPADFAAYLERFGDGGVYSEVARDRLAGLSADSELSGLETGAVNQRGSLPLQPQPDLGTSTDPSLAADRIHAPPPSHSSKHPPHRRPPPPERRLPRRH